MGLQNSNNRSQVSITVASSSIVTTPATASTDTKPFEVTLGGSSNVWTLYDAVNSGYLYAASSSSNYLKNQATSTTWTISFSSSAAVLTSAAQTSRNIMRYNSTSSLFSCYSSGQAAIYLYQAVPTITSFTPTSGSSGDISGNYGNKFYRG